MDRLEDRMEAEVAFMAWRGTVPPGCGTLARLLLEAKEMASSRSRSSARVWNQSRVDFLEFFPIGIICSHHQLFTFIFAHCLKIIQNVAFEFWYFSPIFVLLKLTYRVSANTARHF